LHFFLLGSRWFQRRLLRIAFSVWTGRECSTDNFWWLPDWVFGGDSSSNPGGTPEEVLK